jgi:hypothetical protein
LSADETAGNLESLRSVYKLLKAYHGNGSAAVRNIIDHYSIDRRLATIKDWLQTTSTGASMQNGPGGKRTNPDGKVVQLDKAGKKRQRVE